MVHIIKYAVRVEEVHKLQALQIYLQECFTLFWF